MQSLTTADWQMRRSAKSLLAETIYCKISKITNEKVAPFIKQSLRSLLDYSLDSLSCSFIISYSIIVQIGLMGDNMTHIT